MTATSPQDAKRTEPAISYTTPPPEALPSPDPNLLSEPISTKKSHARKQPEGHIPRPRNAFILFRSALVRQDKLPPDVQKDHCKISRYAGDLWHHLDDVQKAPWLSLAEKEKLHHSATYPGYRYNPASELPGRNNPRRKKNRAPLETHIVANGAPTPPLLPNVPGRRSSSCPPVGASPVPTSPSGFAATALTFHTVTRDDHHYGRRPSQVTMYQSVASSNEMRAELPTDMHVFPWVTFKEDEQPLPTSWPYVTPEPGAGILSNVCDQTTELLTEVEVHFFRTVNYFRNLFCS